jgi:hypothetical protein
MISIKAGFVNSMVESKQAFPAWQFIEKYFFLAITSDEYSFQFPPTT